MIRRRVLLGLIALLTVGEARAQMPAAPAPPDTHVVWLRGDAVDGLPDLEPALPDTLWFGGSVRLGVGAELAPGVSVDDPFAVLAPVDGDADALDLSLYWAGPVRLGWNEDPATLGEVLAVRGRITGLDEAAPVRDPLRPTPDRRLSIALAVAAVVAAWAIARFVRARRRGRFVRGADPVSEPAWMTFVQTAAPLAEEGFATPARLGDDLGRLSAALRRYVRDRLRVKVDGLPSADIAAAFEERAYPAEKGEAVAVALVGIDELRFRPEPATAAEARRIFVAAFTAVEGLAGVRTGAGTGGRAVGGIELAWRRLRERREAWGDGGGR